MARPHMIVVAGPPGSGKTRYFPVTAFGIDSFNIDDRCAQILGSYRAIPRDVRGAVAKECERFVLANPAAKPTARTPGRTFTLPPSYQDDRSGALPSAPLRWTQPYENPLFQLFKYAF